MFRFPNVEFRRKVMLRGFEHCGCAVDVVRYARCPKVAQLNMWETSGSVNKDVLLLDCIILQLICEQTTRQPVAYSL